MPFYVKETDILIQGTLEEVQATYPVRSDGAGGWEYTGGESKTWWETATTKKDENGEDLFVNEYGDEVPWSQIEWRDD